MSGPLRVALVGGPMYDGLYELLADDEAAGRVDVVVHADHPTLNRAVAERLAAGERLDVISTHGKYAPSQSAWLRPLDGLLPAEVVDALAPRAVDLCRFDGALLCAPRNIDVRVLWWRTDLLEAPPVTWADVEASAGAFGFTGRESGLFGLFYELMAAAGARLFDVDRRPTLTGPAAVEAVARLQRLAAKAPDDLPAWHYDDVDDALLAGRVAMAAAWPGGFDRIRRSDLYERLAPAAYPGGRSYSGCHAWAIPVTSGDVPGAVDLVRRLCSAEAGTREAAAGGVPAHRRALEEHEPVDPTDAARWAVTRATIEDAMLTYPPLVRFPEVEDAGWGALHHTLLGELTADEAVVQMQAAAEAILAEEPNVPERRRFEGKVAIVTGGASGIGAAIVERLRSEGGTVVVVDLADRADRRCDVTDQAAVEATFDAVVAEHGRLDVLVNSAGIAHVGTLATTTEADLDRVYAVNVKGVANCLRAGVRHMAVGGGGAIVNLASIASVVGIPDRFAYSMSKGAVLTMTYSVATDFLADGIRCNAISPARVHTPFVDRFLADSYPGREEEMFAQLSATQPIGRMARPDEVAALAAYLCSDEAAFVTGSNHLIDGGFTGVHR